MNKEEIMEHLLGVKPNKPMSEKDREVLKSLKTMEQLARINTLCEIMDDVRIDLDTEIMEKGVLGSYTDELMALRVANKDAKTDNLDSSASATSQRAFDLLNK